MNKTMLFKPGQIVATPGAVEALEASGEEAMSFLRRHLTGDWGDVCPEDKIENNRSLARGYRLLSEYKTANGERLWLITEHDRSATTFLLPEEY